MNDFKVLIDSLGHYSLSALSDAGVEKIHIWSDAMDRTARMEICLRTDNWDARAKAIRAMTDVREVFLEDLSLSYGFGPTGDAISHNAAERTSVFAA